MPDKPIFPPVPTDQWEAQIAKDLRGADYQQKLVWQTPEGFAVRPYYRREDLDALGHLRGTPGHPPYLRSSKSTGNGWLIRQDIRVRDFETANRDAMMLLARGAGSVGFDLRDCTNIEAGQLRQLLGGLPLTEMGLHFTAYGKAPELLPMLAEYVAESQPEHVAESQPEPVAESQPDPAAVSGSVEADPLGMLAGRGNYLTDMYTDMNAVREGMEFCHESLPGFHALVVKGSLFHNAGAGITQTLAYTLAMGAEYLVQLTEMGMRPARILPHMRFRMATGSSYFLEMAKFRAARYLWSRIQEGFGVEQPVPMFIYALTSRHNQSLYDPYSNLLRSTTAAMSAAIGGVDELSVEPFDGAFRSGNPFAERIARNTQLILKEEAYMDRVIDPAAGSYYIEQLTDKLISSAWKLFLEVHEHGGFLKSLHDGYIQDAIRKSAAEKDRRLATRKEVVLGTNQYPDFEELASPSIQTLNELECALPEEEQIIEPVIAYRKSRHFDHLRLNTERSAVKRPLVFMLTYGNLAMRRARAMFACNFFACAGFEVVDNLGFGEVEEGVAAALKSGADILVLCSADEEYPSMAGIVTDRLAGADHQPIPVIAGYPGEHLETIRNAGIPHFIHVRSNLLEELTRYQELLGIKPNEA